MNVLDEILPTKSVFGRDDIIWSHNIHGYNTTIQRDCYRITFHNNAPPYIYSIPDAWLKEMAEWVLSKNYKDIWRELVFLKKFSRKYGENERILSYDGVGNIS
jgi:hypothetical protein